MNDKHARCEWCGASESDHWTTSAVNYRIYCSNTCKRAGELPNLVCGFFIIVALTIPIIVNFGILSLIIIGPMILCMVIPVRSGMKARQEIRSKSRYDDDLLSL